MTFVKIFFAILYLGFAVFFSQQFKDYKTAYYSDSYEYMDQAAKISTANWDGVLHHNRTPLYPLCLLIAKKVQIEPNQLSAFLNFSSLIVLLFLPGLIGVFIGLPLLIIGASAMYLSYVNTALTESVLLFVLSVALFLSVQSKLFLAKKKLWFWGGLLCLEVLLLLSFRPSFKAFVFFELLAGFAYFYLKKPSKMQLFSFVRGCVVVVFFTFTANNLLFSKSGGTSLKLNKMVVLLYEVMVLLPETPRSEIPENLQPTYVNARTCAFKKHEAQGKYHIPCVPEVTLDEADLLYGFLLKKYWPTFLRSHTKKMFDLVRYSSWGSDYGNTGHGIGFKKGFGVTGLFLLSILFGAMFFFAGKNIAFTELTLALLSCGLFALYSFGIQFWLCSDDPGRFSLPWLLPAFAGLSLSWYWSFMKFKARSFR